MPEACPTIPAGVPGVFLLNESVLTALWPQPFTPRTLKFAVATNPASNANWILVVPAPEMMVVPVGTVHR
jgi:hypothetical protein